MALSHSALELYIHMCVFIVRCVDLKHIVHKIKVKCIYCVNFEDY